ncbi:MAG: hypothetical protein IPP94_05160 [Ignavibacteria bacterium]|jgi:hypothetical protein|nr:hypothetical protein [Ignavibacteria bacterium]
MPTLFAANESSVMLNGTSVEGVRSIEYRHQNTRQNIYALGSAERIGIASGPQVVEGRLRVVSTNAAFNALTTDASFQITATLKQGETQMTVTFDDCFLLEKEFAMAANGHGEAVYRFTATRVREEAA